MSNTATTFVFVVSLGEKYEGSRVSKCFTSLESATEFALSQPTDGDREWEIIEDYTSRLGNYQTVVYWCGTSAYIKIEKLPLEIN